MCSAVGGKESVTAKQRAFRAQIHMEPSSRVSIYAWCKKFGQKGCICKVNRSGLRLMELRTAFGLTSSKINASSVAANHKNSLQNPA
jgi:hypothetical protein